MKMPSSIFLGVLLVAKLILLPNVLDESLPHEPFLPASVNQAVLSLKGLFAESDKAARRYLRRFLSHEEMQKVALAPLNEHTQAKELAELLKPVLSGETWGVVSDAGLPCIADPGANLVRLARKKGVAIEAISGPSSLILAIQLLGFPAQAFSFHGYLPREEVLLEKALKEMNGLSKKGTQIWIEAPYRSAKMFDAALRFLDSDSVFGVAVQLTTPYERVEAHPIREWKQIDFPLGKEPAVFLLTRLLDEGISK